MKRMLMLLVLMLLLYGATFFACSNNTTADSEKGTIETMTDKAAKEAVDRIRTPIKKAHLAEKQQADRFSIMEESLKE